MNTSIINARITSGEYHPKTINQLNETTPSWCELRIILNGYNNQPKKHKLVIWSRKYNDTAYSIYKSLTKTNRISCNVKLHMLPTKSNKITMIATDGIILMPPR
jgi:hypothetical protein